MSTLFDREICAHVIYAWVSVCEDANPYSSLVYELYLPRGWIVQSLTINSGSQAQISADNAVSLLYDGLPCYVAADKHQGCTSGVCLYQKNSVNHCVKRRACTPLHSDAEICKVNDHPKLWIVTAHWRWHAWGFLHFPFLAYSVHYWQLFLYKTFQL